MAINKVILVGNVGRDPELRYLENRTAVCSFSLATSETYTNKNNEKVTNTEWHNIVMWRNLAEIAAKHVKKGSLLYIEGKIRTRSYEDKATGVKKYITEIVADTMKMLGKKQENGTPDVASVSHPDTIEEADAIDTFSATPEDDLPF